MNSFEERIKDEYSEWNPPCIQPDTPFDRIGNKAPETRELTHKQRKDLMGCVVEVTKELCKIRYWKSAEVEWRLVNIPNEERRAGWVVGYSWRKSGVIKTWDGEEGAHKRITNVSRPEGQPKLVTDVTIPVVLVRYWMGASETLVSESGLVHPTDMEPINPQSRAMNKFAEQYPENYEEHCQQLSEFAQDMDRDEKGRFV